MNTNNDVYECPKCLERYSSPLKLKYSPEHVCPKTKRVVKFKAVA